MRWPEWQRKAYYEDVMRIRGEVGMRKLIGEVKNQWNSQQSLL